MEEKKHCDAWKLLLHNLLIFRLKINAMNAMNASFEEDALMSKSEALTKDKTP